MAGTSDTRARLIDAALEQVETYGYRASTTKRIAAAAGLNEASIFRLFGSKDALVRVAIYERTITAERLPRARSIYAESLEENFAYILREYMRSVILQMPIYRVFMMRTEYDVKMNAEIFAKANSITTHFVAHLTYLRSLGRAREADYEALAETMSSLYTVTAIDITSSGQPDLDVAKDVGAFADRWATYLSSILAPSR